MNEVGAGPVLGPARARFVTELTVLRTRGGLSAKEVSDWIRLSKNGKRVAPATIGDWFKPAPRLPRSDQDLLLVIECLHVQLSDKFTREKTEYWKRLHKNALREPFPYGSSDDPALAGTEPGTVSAFVVGAVPREPDHFVHRDQLTDLEEGLTRGRVAVVVTGMRGAGKTQLAAAYARQVLDQDTTGVLVGWVNAETADTLHTGLAEIAEHLNVAAADGDPVKSAHRLRDHLNNHAEQHLLVLDNATDLDLLRTVTPTRGGTRVVITTADNAMRRLADVVVEAGHGYTPEQSHEFLRAATGIDDLDGEQEVAAELGYLPLALAAAAATITTARPPLPYPMYLERLRSQPLPKALRRRADADHPRSTDQAIMLSVTAAEASTGDPELDTVVRWLLGLFAILAPSGVQRSLLHHQDPELDVLVDEAIGHCVRHSLLSWSTEETSVLAHRLTIRILRERALSAGRVDEILTDALNVVFRCLPDLQRTWTHRTEGNDLVDQIEAIWSSGLPEQTTPTLHQLALGARTWVVTYLVGIASLNRAITIGAIVLADAEQVLGPDHPHTLIACGNLASSYQSAGRLDEATAIFEQNLADTERVMGPDHPDTLCCRNNLASSYESVGRLDEATALHERNLADAERVLGPNHPSTLSCRNNLASSYRSVGRLDEATAICERNLAVREQVLGPDHPDTLFSRNNLANSYSSVGRLDEATALHERNLAVRERVLGPDHPHTLISRGNLASSYQSAGRLDEATALRERNLADAERVLGPDHPHTLTSCNNLANSYSSVGRFDEATALHERNLADAERVLGPDHPDTLSSRNNLASSYESAGRFDEATALHERNLADTERVLGPDHPNTLIARRNLAQLRNRQ